MNSKIIFAKSKKFGIKFAEAVRSVINLFSPFTRALTTESLKKFLN